MCVCVCIDVCVCVCPGENTTAQCQGSLSGVNVSMGVIRGCHNGTPTPAAVSFEPQFRFR